MAQLKTARGRRPHPSWIGLWLVTFVMLYESDLRSIGAAERVGPIGTGLVRGFWVEDLALLLPLIAVVMSKRMARLLCYRTLAWVVGLWSYGLAVALIKGNDFSPLMSDVRVFLALFAGFALVEAAPAGLLLLANALTRLSAGCVLLSVIVVLALPDSQIVMSTNARITAESGFMFLGPALVLLAPAIILATLAGHRWLVRLSWATGLALLVESVVLLQTRSTVVIVLFALLLAYVATAAISGVRKVSGGRTPRRLMGRGTVLALLVLFSLVVSWRWEGAKNLFGRLGSAMQLSTDVTWVYRYAEVTEVLQGMQPVDHLTGLGLGPAPHADHRGEPVFALHIGWMNVWWRFGAIVFIALAASVIFLLVRWIWNTRRWYRKGPSQRSSVALLAAAPGILVVAALACVSGGWGTIGMLSLGISWGCHRRLASLSENSRPGW